MAPKKKDAEDLLTKLTLAGLSQNEAAFYLASLKLGKAPVRKIANMAQVNRSSAYTLFESLKSRGIVSSVKKSGKTVVDPLMPQKFIELQREQLESLEKSVEELQYLFRIAKQEPGVKFFEGEEGLKNVLKSILDEASDICIFGDGDAFQKAIPGWTELYSSKRVEKGIPARILLRGTPNAIASIKQLRNVRGKKRELTHARVLPEALNIVGGFDVFGQKTILYSFEGTCVAVMIESPIIRQMMKSIFEILWSLAETYENTLLR